MNSSIPDSFPTAMPDRFVSAYFSPKCDVMLQMEMKFKDRLDSDTLRTALSFALDAEPVLGCRFSIEEGQVVWRRLHPDQRSNFREFKDEREYLNYKEQSIDPVRGPALHGAVMHGRTGDTILFKIAHEAADAGGAKDISSLVALLYRNLKKDAAFKPPFNITGSRGLDQVMKHVPFYGFPRIWMNAIREISGLIVHRRSFNPFHAKARALNREYIEREISAERVSLCKDLGARYDAKLNDILLTAFLRAFSRTGWDRKSQLRCAMTVDLRKWHIPGGQAESIGNLSGIEIVNLGTDRGETILDTLGKVVRYTEKRKQNWIGLTHFPGMLKLMSSVRYDKMRSFFTEQQHKDIEREVIFPMFTNLGPIHDEKLCFETTPEKACLIAPATYPPFFGIGISGYKGGLTVSAAAFPETRQKVNEILDCMLDELPK